MTSFLRKVVLLLLITITASSSSNIHKDRNNDSPSIPNTYNTSDNDKILQQWTAICTNELLSSPKGKKEDDVTPKDLLSLLMKVTNYGDRSSSNSSIHMDQPIRDIQDVPLSIQYQFALATCENKSESLSLYRAKPSRKQQNHKSTSVCEEGKVTLPIHEFRNLVIDRNNIQSIRNVCEGIAPILHRKQMISDDMIWNYTRSLTTGNIEMYNYKDRVLLDDVQFNASEYCPCIPTPDVIVFPSNMESSYTNFGEYCSPWDRMLNPKCVNPRTGLPFENDEACVSNGSEQGLVPDWCCRSWCFVDTEDCQRPHSQLYERGFHTMVDFASVSSAEEAKENYLSYETCGNIDVYTPDAIYDALKAYNLRVGFPGDSSDGYTLTTVSDTERGGSTYDFMELISLKYNITWIQKEISEKSLSKYSSSYTACVHDIAIGELDMCIGAFWTTTERLLLSSFSNAIYYDEFYLIVYAKTDSNFYSMLSTPFKPFEGGAWIFIIFIAIYTANAVRIIQKTHVVVYEEDEQSDRSLRNDAKSRSFLGKCIRYVGFGIFNGVNSFTKGEVTNLSDEPSVAEKVVGCGFAIFGVIVLTAYTATSAAFMINTSRMGEYQNLDEVIGVGGNICIPNAVYDQFGSMYSSAKDLLIPKKNANEIFDDMASSQRGTCIAAILDLDGFRKALIDDEDNCDKMKVGGVLLTMANAFPINEKYRDDITYVVDEGVSLGEYFKSKETAQTTFLSSAECNINGEMYDPGQPIMSINQLMAPFFITFLCTSLGLLIVLYKSQKSNDLSKKQRIQIDVFNEKERMVHNSYNTDEGLKDDDKSLDEELRIDIKSMPISDLLKVMNQIKVHDDIKKQAMNSLPNTTQLQNLVFFHCCSQKTRNRMLLDNHFDFAYLLSLARRSRWIDIDDIASTSVSHMELKSRIIDSILDDPDLTHIVNSIMPETLQ